MTKTYLSLPILALLIGCQNAAEPEQSFPDVTLYGASHVVAMDAATAQADMIAVKDEHIIAVGDTDDLTAKFPGATLNMSYSDKVIVPGLIDPHVHMTLGAMMYGLDFVPPWDMETPKGLVKGLSNKADFMARVAELEAEAPDGPLVLYGYHNLVQGDLTRADLDTITSERPLFIWHYSGHDFYLNSAAIAYTELKPEMAEQFHGVNVDANGELEGRVYEDAALVLFAKLGPLLLNPAHIKRGYDGYETLLKRSGVTTVAEMGYGIFGRALEDQYMSQFYSREDGYRLYLVPEHRAFSSEFGKGSVQAILDMASDDSRAIPVLPQVKLFTDAAFFSQTMKLTAPGYIGGQSKGTDGLWVTTPDTLPGVMAPYWDAGIDIHIHSNGDAAQDNTLSAFAEVKGEPQDGQRLIIEHAGLLTPNQLDKAAGLGVGLSAASHYVHYMGELYEEAIGEKIHYITPLASANARDMPITLHSDAPLAPPQPLRAASVHMTRSTREGGTSTPSEQLSAEQALRAITLDAAWSLGLDDELGSISVGKLADFTVLDANPLTTPAEDWPDIGIAGVVISGVSYPYDETE